MSGKADESAAEVDGLIAALRREKESLKRRFALLRKHQGFLDEASRWYLDLWRLKWEGGLNILGLSPVERRVLEQVLRHDIQAQEIRDVEVQLHRLISEGRYLTFAEIEGVIEVIDGIIQSLENQKQRIEKQGRSALQTARILASKTFRVSGGVALISVDLPQLNWPSIIGGALLILTTSLNTK